MMKSVWDNFPERAIKEALERTGHMVTPHHMACIRAVWFALDRVQQMQVMMAGDPTPICLRCYGCTDPLDPGKECRGVVLR